MKKFVSATLTLALTLIGLAILSITPANASVPLPEKITYCQAQGNGEFHPITPSVRSLVDNKGNFKQGGINANDIIPPFAWDFGGDDHGNFSGQNWTDKSLNFVDRGCTPLSVELDRPFVTLVPATCAAPTGSLKIEAVDPRLTQTGPTLTGNIWTVSFTKPANDTYTSYVWKDGTTAETITKFAEVSDPVNDALWDSQKGMCRMPDTGAGISGTALVWAGGLIFAGMVLLSVSTLMKRRKD